MTTVDEMPTVETACREVKELLQKARTKLFDAAYAAGQGGNHELDKSLSSVNQNIESMIGLMITLPRLKG